MAFEMVGLFGLLVRVWQIALTECKRLVFVEEFFISNAVHYPPHTAGDKRVLSCSSHQRVVAKLHFCESSVVTIEHQTLWLFVRRELMTYFHATFM